MDIYIFFKNRLKRVANLGVNPVGLNGNHLQALWFKKILYAQMIFPWILLFTAKGLALAVYI